MLVAGFLGTVGGVVQLIVIGGANPHLLSTDLTLSLLIMVVLGGAGSRWGPVVGAVLYVLLDHRLQQLSTSPVVADLPAVLRVPLSQPVFVLGLVFVLVVYFAPGGIVALGARLRRRVARRRLGPGGKDRDGRSAEQTAQLKRQLYLQSPLGAAQSGPSRTATRDSRWVTVFGCTCSAAAVRPTCPPAANQDSTVVASSEPRARS